jgi:hypothetical protein
MTTVFHDNIAIVEIVMDDQNVSIAENLVIWLEHADYVKMNNIFDVTVPGQTVTLTLQTIVMDDKFVDDQGTLTLTMETTGNTLLQVYHRYIDREKQRTIRWHSRKLSVQFTMMKKMR